MPVSFIKTVFSPANAVLSLESLVASPFVVCALWLARRLSRPFRIALAILVLLLYLAAVLSDSQPEPLVRFNLLAILLSALGSLIYDSFFHVSDEKRVSIPPLEIEYTSGTSTNGDEDTRVIEDGMMLNLEDLAPEIDAVSAAEFTARAERVGVFSSGQIRSLEKLITREQHLSKALTLAVAEKTLTLYQALHLLWGKEDRLRIGDFAVMNVLGVGGMGVVYRARKIAGGNEIALKVVPRATQHEARFRREMQLAQLLAHPNIVVAHEVGKTIDRYFISMELVTGRNLQDVVRLHGNLSEAVALQYVLQAARGLEHAHERGVIHRDVKPGNLLLCRDGTVKVADLGLSQEEGYVDQADGRRTTISGTLDFMAPEQASGGTRSTPQLDVFGLGTTLYFLLTGQTYVCGESTHEKLINLTVSHQFHRLPSGSVTARTMKLIRRLTAVEPAERYPSMTAVIAEIEAILDEMGRPFAPRTVRVLVVEDDPAQMFLTVRLLARTNRSIAVLKADRLQFAIDTFAEKAGSPEPIDLVLLDLNLPDSQGRKTVQDFCSAHNDAAVVVLSGSDSEIANDCLRDGATAFLGKSDLNLSNLERNLFTLLSAAQSQVTQE